MLLKFGLFGNNKETTQVALVWTRKSYLCKNKPFKNNCCAWKRSHTPRCLLQVLNLIGHLGKEECLGIWSVKMPGFCIE